MTTLMKMPFTDSVDSYHFVCQIWSIYVDRRHLLLKSSSASSYPMKIIFIIENTKWWYQCSKHVIHSVVFCLSPVLVNTFLLKYVYVTRSVFRTFRRNNIYRFLLDFTGLFSLFLIDCFAALLRPPMEIKRLFFHFKTSYNKTDASVFNLTDI